jgi:AbrB family looped-hinge helix DNA binding protein
MEMGRGKEDTEDSKEPLLMPVPAKARQAHRAAPRGISARITSKGQITIPAAIRKSLGVKPGDRLRFEPQKSGLWRGAACRGKPL